MDGLILELLLGSIESVFIDNWLPCAFRYRPEVPGISNPAYAKTMGVVSKDAATTIVGVFEKSVDGHGIPRHPLAAVVANAFRSQFGSDGGGPFLLGSEHPKDVAHATHFVIRARHQNNPVRLERLSFTSRKKTFGFAIGRNKHSAKSVARCSSNPEPVFGNPFDARADLYGQFPTEFASHDPL